MPKLTRIVIDTLGKLGPKDTIWAYCADWRCKHGSELDIPALRKRKGGDFLLSDLFKVLKCSKCGGRKVELRHGKDWYVPEGFCPPSSLPRG